MTNSSPKSAGSPESEVRSPESADVEFTTQELEERRGAPGSPESEVRRQESDQSESFEERRGAPSAPTPSSETEGRARDARPYEASLSTQHSALSTGSTPDSGLRTPDSNLTSGLRPPAFHVLPSLDIIDGNVVRLVEGRFDTVKSYGRVRDVLSRLLIPAGTLLHVVDLEGSRQGAPRELDTIRAIREAGYRVQVGGGVRSVDDAKLWISAGAERIVLGTLVTEDVSAFTAIVNSIGSDRVVPAIDVRNGQVRIAGWERGAASSLETTLDRVAAAGIREILATDIRRDGKLAGPGFDLYRAMRRDDLTIIASGGVTTVADLVSLRRNAAVSAAVVGKALVEGKLRYEEAFNAVSRRDTIPARVIPCLDIRDGRVVKGVRFENLRDAGDPVEAARRYEAEGADELVVLDVSATDEGRAASLETIRQLSAALFIPLTVGGGVRNVDDFRALLRAGADRVAINTAALRDPRLIDACANEFGIQAVVLSCDAKRNGSSWEAMVRSGKESSGVDAIEWCVEAERRGAGEILLTSVDRDGTNAGYDIELLRAVSSRINIGVIASGGAGSATDFAVGIESGGARAVLGASTFHERKLTIADVKEKMKTFEIPVREVVR